MVTDSPLEAQMLAQLTEQSVDQVEQQLAELAAEYESQERGFQLAHVAGGWRFQSHPLMAPYVERFVLEGQSAKLSAAALETLAIVAYKQPLSRAQIAAIRGVSVDSVVRTLEQRGYIGEVARDPGPGQAVLFGTTPNPATRAAVAGKVEWMSSVAVNRMLMMSSWSTPLRPTISSRSATVRCSICSTESMSTVVAPRRARTELFTVINTRAVSRERPQELPLPMLLPSLRREAHRR